MEIKEVVKQEKYQNYFSKYNLFNRFLFVTFGGSHAYGTNIEGSDIDIRGCAFNPLDNILLGNDFEQYDSNNSEMDICIYSMDKLFKLLSNCNPNTIELLGLPLDKYAYLSESGKILLDNKEIFLSKKAIQSFGGYATQQLRRLGNKAVRSVSQTEKEEYILNSMKNAKYGFSKQYLRENDKLDLYVDTSENKDLDSEIFMDMDLKHYPLRDYLGMYQELNSILRSYTKNSKRNEYAASHNKLGKHMMHLVRLYLMCFDILEKGEINTYRDKDRDYLLSIREGYYLDEKDQPKDEFYTLVNKYEQRLNKLKETTKLPESPDMNKINELHKKLNRKILKEML